MVMATKEWHEALLSILAILLTLNDIFYFPLIAPLLGFVRKAPIVTCWIFCSSWTDIMLSQEQLGPTRMGYNGSGFTQNVRFIMRYVCKLFHFASQWWHLAKIISISIKVLEYFCHRKCSGSYNSLSGIHSTPLTHHPSNIVLSVPSSHSNSFLTFPTKTDIHSTV